MQPKIIESRQFILVGMSFFGDPFDSHSGWEEENEIGHLWKRFTAYYSRHREHLDTIHKPGAAYEVHIYNEETSEKGLFEVFVGMEANLEKLKIVPAELSIKILPTTQYAIFTFKGEEINSDWERILHDWLKTTQYLSTYSYNFQYYDERFKGLNKLEESAIDVFFPIQKAA